MQLNCWNYSLIQTSCFYPSKNSNKSKTTSDNTFKRFRFKHDTKHGCFFLGGRGWEEGEGNSMPKGWGKRCTSILNTRKSSNYAVFIWNRIKCHYHKKTCLYIEKYVQHLSCSLFLTPFSIIAKRINWCTSTQSWTFQKSSVFWRRTLLSSKERFLSPQLQLPV